MNWHYSLDKEGETCGRMVSHGKPCVVGSPERLTLLGLAGHTPQLVHRDDEGRMVSLLSHFTHSQVLDYSVVVLVPLPSRNAQNHRTFKPPR
ncbi:hypothetical protein O3P69_004782 [Scylla paramamosain]|uniref:Uncharacterized protein n=1 Tax=Scylla paramamosain TaxID=85552 RepID=A0AAW0UB97_SCYPA